MMNKKGASALFTGIMITALSVVVMITITTLVIPFFNGIKDNINFKNNKETLLSLNEKLLNTKNADIGSVFEIDIAPNNYLEIDGKNNQIIIRQEIKNYNTKIKEQTINNLTITKENNEIVFVLDLAKIININSESVILNPIKQKIKIEIQDIKNNKSYISFKKTTGTVNKIVLFPQHSIFSKNQTITATVLPLDSNIYYTIDGTEPTQNSMLYANEIIISETTTIKFKAFKEGYEPSTTVTGIYTKIEANLLFFNKYTETNPLFDLSENQNKIINNNVNFGKNGAIFTGDTTKSLFIKNYWDEENYSLNLGTNNFTLETMLSKGYTGTIFNKNGFLGGMNLTVTNEGLVEFKFGGSDQIFYSYGIVTDDEYVYISDFTTHSVQKRKKNNWDLVLISGGPRATSAIDGYSGPYGLALDEEFIYISDNSNCRIVKRYKSNFEFHSMLSNGCGTNNNQIRYNWGIAVDNEHIYVTEYSHHRVKKFTKDTFEYVSHIGGTSAGSGINQFNAPRGITVDDEFIYIADSSNHRLKKHLKTDLSFYSSVGSTGAAGDEQLYTPHGVTVDESYIYVADYSNNRIMIRNKDEAMSYFNKIISIGTYEDDGYFYGPVQIYVDKEYIYLVEYSGHRIKKINKENYTVESVFSNLSFNDDTIILPFEITNDGEYIYYTDVGLHRVVKRKIEDMSVARIIGGPFVGNTNSTFNTPYGLTIKNNRLYVTDNGNNKIKIFDKDTLDWIYTCSPSTTVFRYPVGITYDNEYFYVTTIYSSTMDSLHKMEITDNSCEIIQTIGGTNGTGEMEFTNPYGITSDDTYVYVADSTNNRIKKHLKSDLSFDSQLGHTLYANQFINTVNIPYNILYHKDYLYITNTSYPGVQKYTPDFEYISTIGFSSGYEHDTFVSPRGVTIAGDWMFILDAGQGRIIKRNMNEFETNIDIIGAGTDYNFFYNVYSMDSDDDYYYIVNYGIGRVEKRNKKDLSLVAYYGGPHSATTVIGNFLNAPRDVLVDDEFIYVSNTSGHSILKLNKEDMSYNSHFGTGTAGNTTTTVNAPRQIAIYDDKIYIADTGNNRIVILNKTNMSFIESFGTTGSNWGQFNGLYGVAVDKLHIYTSEGTNHRIQKFDVNSKTFIIGLGEKAGSGDNQFNTPHNISIDKEYIYVGDSSNHRIKKHLKEDLSFISKIGSSGYGENNFRIPYSVRVKEDLLYVADYSNNRFHIRNSENLSLIEMIDLSTYSNDGLHNPFGVAVDNDYIYITDSTNNRLIKKNKETFETVAEIGGPIAGSGNAQFNAPYGVAIDDDFVYVADYSNNRIKKHLKEDLSFVYSYTPGLDKIYNPVSVAVDDSYLYVTTIYSSSRDWLTKIDIKNESWTIVSKIGSTTGIGNEQFNDPRGVAVDDKYVYIADTANHRIHKRNKEDLSLVALYGIGAPYGVSQSGSVGTNAFSNPYGVAVYEDLLYIVDYSNRRIKIFDKNFNYIYKFGKYGWGQDMLYNPTSVALDDTHIYIADYTNHRIIKRSRNDLENIKNNSKTNNAGIYGFNINTITSYKRITNQETQIVLRRNGNQFCIYINGEKDNCEVFLNTPTNLTFPEINTRYGSAATTTTSYLSEYQNDYPYMIGNNGLYLPGNGTIKYFKIYDSSLSDEEIYLYYEKNK